MNAIAGDVIIRITLFIVFLGTLWLLDIFLEKGGKKTLV